MELKDGEHSYSIVPASDGEQHWLSISKDGVQVGNPDLDPNLVVDFILELRRYLLKMLELP